MSREEVSVTEEKVNFDDDEEDRGLMTSEGGRRHIRKRWYQRGFEDGSEALSQAITEREAAKGEATYWAEQHGILRRMHAQAITERESWKKLYTIEMPKLAVERDQAITERDAARNMRKWYAEKATELEDALDEAREALRPFAEETAFHLKHDDSCCSVDGEALERARAAIASSPPKRPSE